MAASNTSAQLRNAARPSRRSFCCGSAGLAAMMLTGGTGAAASGRRARSVIILLLEGGLSHLETWDPKPDAPGEVRGDFGTIRTTNPDLIIGEHTPGLARLAHLYNVIRSVQNLGSANHDHALHRLLTGYDHPTIAAPQDVLVNHFPSQGAIVARQRSAVATNGLPPFVAVPDRTLLGRTRRLLGSGYLGAAYEAFDSGPVPARADAPYVLPAGLTLGPGISPSRLADRRRLLQEFDHLQHHVEQHQRNFTTHQQQAFELLLGGRGRAAFDLNAEPIRTRERYGDSPMGQGALLGRRLVEAGVSYVLVNLGNGDNLWDTHSDNGRRLKSELLPPMDRSVSALLGDLNDRGLLDETLVVLLTEFGRTPHINKEAGRDHWPDAFSVMLAGGGLVQGRVLGSTTPRGEEPATRPIPVVDVLATIYHQLGISPDLMLPDALGRPTGILPPAQPVNELL